MPNDDEERDLIQIQVNLIRSFELKILKPYNSDPSFYKPSSLGAAFKELRAHGITTDGDYQTYFTIGVSKLISQTRRKFIERKQA